MNNDLYDALCTVSIPVFMILALIAGVFVSTKKAEIEVNNND